MEDLMSWEGTAISTGPFQPQGHPMKRLLILASGSPASNSHAPGREHPPLLSCWPMLPI